MRLPVPGVIRVPGTGFTVLLVNNRKLDRYIKELFSDTGPHAVHKLSSWRERKPEVSLAIASIAPRDSSQAAPEGT